jgi:hypothetical protein
MEYWMKKGEVKIMKMNIKKGIEKGSVVNDDWNKKMVFGVGNSGI